MKKFKTKRKSYRKNVVFILIGFIFIILFIFVSMKNLSTNHTDFINFILEQNGFIKKEDTTIFSYFISNLDLLLDDYYFKGTNHDSMIVYKEEVKVYQDDEKKDNPLVYIYSTHDNEKYSDNKSVLDVNKLLKEKLSLYKINSIVEENRVSTFLDKENLNYNKSYLISRRFLEEVILKYPTLNYFIDIHRDSVDGSVTTTIIDNKPYARIMFVLGLENPNYLDNKKIITKLNDFINEHYPNLSRGIYEKKGSGVNGVYNQDFHKNTILVEVGGIENNYEEVLNSTEIITKALYHIIGDKNE